MNQDAPSGSRWLPRLYWLVLVGNVGAVLFVLVCLLTLGPPPPRLVATVRPISPAPKEITNSIGMKFVLIPGDTFRMGSPDEEKGANDDEKPQHDVRISAFYLGVTEVTRGQFRRFVDEEDYQTEAEMDGKGCMGWNEEKKRFERDPKYTWQNNGFNQTDEHPVVNVSWNDAQAFIVWLCRKEGKIYRLPTEAEWEYACRGGTKTAYSWGDDPAKFEEYAWCENNAETPMKVGKKKPNPWGLYDMHGNVWEWCSDGYAFDYYNRSPVDDPPGAAEVSQRVRRGGCWFNGPLNARSAIRHSGAPGNRVYMLGFRLALVQSGR